MASDYGDPYPKMAASKKKKKTKKQRSPGAITPRHGPAAQDATRVADPAVKEQREHRKHEDRYRLDAARARQKHGVNERGEPRPRHPRGNPK